MSDHVDQQRRKVLEATALGVAASDLGWTPIAQAQPGRHHPRRENSLLPVPTLPLPGRNKSRQACSMCPPRMAPSTGHREAPEAFAKAVIDVDRF
jgi:hypothetical protein